MCPPHALTAAHLLKEDGRHLAVERRLEGKVDLKGQPGGVGRGAQPAAQTVRVAASSGKECWQQGGVLESKP